MGGSNLVQGQIWLVQLSSIPGMKPLSVEVNSLLCNKKRNSRKKV